MAYVFGSIWDRFNRNALNELSKSVEYQGKSIQDLVAEGQLTPAQYAELVSIVNSNVKKGSITSADIDKNNFSVDQTMISDSLRQMIAGDAPINAVPADGGVTTAKIASKAVTENKTSFLKPSRNLFNNDYVAGRLTYANPTELRFRKLLEGEHDEVIVMQIEALKTYTIKVHEPEKKDRFRLGVHNTHPIFGANQDINRTVVNDDSLNEVTFTNTSTGRYLMLQLSGSGLRPKVQVEEGAVATEYVNHYSLPNDYLDPDEFELKNGIVNGENISDVVIIPENLYDATAAIPNTVFDATGQPTALTGPSLSDFIPGKENDIITVSSGNIQNLIAMYDSNNNFLGRISGNFNGVHEPFTTRINQSGTAKIRVNVPGQATDFMIVKGNNLPDRFIPFGEPTKYRIPWLEVGNDQFERVMSTKWTGKKIQLFGTSITYWDQRPYWGDESYNIIGYATHIRERTGATVINRGRQGATLAVKEGVPSIHTILTGTDLTDTDAIIIEGGTNDNGNSIPIGELGERNDSEFDVSTVAGALRSMIHYAYSQNPNIKIYLTTSNQGRVFHYQTYVPIQKEIAKMYALPLININEESQINVITAFDLLFDGVHPNNEGYEAFADVIVPALLNY